MTDKTELLPGKQDHQLSEEVQELVSYRPHWFVRRGNSIFMTIGLMLLALSFFIRYPDLVKSSGRLTALNPPRLVVSRAEGKLAGLFVSDDQVVKKGMHLGYVESTGQYDEIVKLQNWLTKAVELSRIAGVDWLNEYPLPELSGLGELQSAYQAFQNQVELTRQTLGDGYFVRKRAALARDKIYLETLKKTTLEQKQLSMEDHKLQQDEYAAYEKLAREKVIAPLELNQYKSRLLAKEQTVDNLTAQEANGDIGLHRQYKETLELQKVITDQQQSFRSGMYELKSLVEKWMQQYVLAAPESGRLLFVTPFRENQVVSPGEAMFYVEPAETKYYVEIMAGQKGLGKIAVGQRVILRLDGYPSSEFGRLQATVSHISRIPNRSDSFLVKAELKKGLLTDYDKKIAFRNGLIAEAEIVTDERRLFDRLTGELGKILNR